MKKITFLFLLSLFFSAISWQASAQYCVSTFTDQGYEFVTNVNYAGINNTSGGIAPNNDYTGMVANVNIGGTNTLSVTIDPDALDYVYAFIDWNQNGILNDAGEVYTLAANVAAPGPYTMDVTVPATALEGNTRMRVMVAFNRPTPNPCQVATYGEVEDYTVNVSSVVGNAPVIACPMDIVASNDPGVCTAIVNFSNALAIDPEDGVLTYNPNYGPT